MATAMLSVFDSAVLQKLPVLEQDRVVVLWPLGKGGTEVPLDFAEYEGLRDNSLTLQDLAGFVHWGAVDAAMSDGDEPRRLGQAMVTGNFFAVLGASPVLGRLLQPGDRGEGADHVMVISFAVWQRLYGGDRAVIGKQLTWLSAGWSYTIVGVAPPGLDYPLGTDVWMPAWSGSPVDMIGRLKPGATALAAKAELAAVVERYQERTGRRGLTGAFARELPAVIYGDVRPALLIMTAAAGLLLLIACSNAGNLFLLCATGRGRIRSASEFGSLGQPGRAIGSRWLACPATSIFGSFAKRRRQSFSITSRCPFGKACWAYGLAAIPCRCSPAFGPRFDKPPRSCSSGRLSQ